MDSGGAGGKAEPDRAVGLARPATKGRGSLEKPYWPMVSGGAEGGRMQGGAKVSTGRGEAVGTEAGGADRGSSRLDGAGG